MNPAYKTIITNENGINGSVTADNGFTVQVAPVKGADLEHTNPEQLIGASWATCLNATIYSILKLKQLDNKARVRVEVLLFTHEKTGYRFELHAKAAIENMPFDEVKAIVEHADKFCPVSKLVSGRQGVTLEVEAY
ncbi:OsmC family protein [Acholeplasma hippikon]|uniref:OsmC-like protein n=2 Tax=Acholeplasma hippikon TaxID=264636 RepID=A0A449BKK3_9MOLU|nr:OsmC family protein [Acholeplasma hippikon]VEU83005.1 OsmC-like protein [Acholeplasma hippikon]